MNTIAHAGARFDEASNARTLVALLGEIRQARFHTDVACVRCGAGGAIRWGHFAGRQRYRCRSCRRTFSDLTATPAAYLKRLTLLPSCRACLQRALSVRATARVLGVHPTTAFRWRHRLLRGMMPFDVEQLSGRVEIDEGWILCANTVLRNLPGCHRAWRGRRSLADPTQRRSWIVALRDHTGRSTVESAGFDRPASYVWSELFACFVRPGSTVVTRNGRLSSAAMAARTCGLALARHRPQGVPHVAHRHDGARELLCRVRRWLRRFRGVSSRYLSNYLYWHGLLDPQRRTAVRLDRLLCWPWSALHAEAR